MFKYCTERKKNINREGDRKRMACCTKLPKIVKDQMILFCKTGTAWSMVNLVSGRTHNPKYHS